MSRTNSFKLKPTTRMKSNVIFARMSQEVSDQLRQFCEKNGCSMNTAVNQMIEHCLNESES